MRFVETGNADSPIPRSPSREQQVGPSCHFLQHNTETACGGGGLDGATAEIPRLPRPRYPESGGTGELDVMRMIAQPCLLSRSCPRGT